MPLKLMYITNDVEVARIADDNGVDRIWIDLEKRGKAERQKNMDCVISDHSLEDVSKIAKVIKKSELLVRIDPWSKSSPEEIEQVLERGAQRIMLPMWKTAEETDLFLNTVRGRAGTTLLLETKEAAECLDQVLKNKFIDEIHIGLNDLHLSYGLKFMFELLTNGIVEQLCAKLKAAGVPYGFGGIARLGYGMIPAEKIIMEHYRLGSTRAILSRSFCDINKMRDTNKISEMFSASMSRLREYEKTVERLTPDQLEKNRLEVKEDVLKIVKGVK